MAMKAMKKGARKSDTQKRPVKFDADDDGDEDLDSDDEEAAEERGRKLKVAAGSDDESETAEQKRLRLAKKYLAEVGDVDEKRGGIDGSDDGSDDDDDDDDDDGGGDVVGQKLKRARMEATGGLRRSVASSLLGNPAMPSPESYRWMTGHKLALTCVALSADDRHAFTGSKDNALIQYDVETGQRIGYVRRAWKPGPTKAREGEVLSLAASPDGRLLASGGRDKLVRLYDLRQLQSEAATDGAAGSGAVGAGGAGPLSGSSGSGGSAGGGNNGGGMSCLSLGGGGARAFELKSFRGHKDAVSGLAFQAGVGASTLFSASLDRTIKLWNVKDMGFMDTLFGHQSEITAIDVLRKESAVTSGRDRTARLWKWGEDKQLVFRGSVGCTTLECCRMLSDDTFATGGDDGGLSLWSTLKKKPVYHLEATGGAADHALALALASLSKRDASRGASQPPAVAARARTADADDGADVRTDGAEPGAAASAAAAAAGDSGGRQRPWVVSVTSVRTSDLLASGSSDGHVRLWKATSGARPTLAPVAALPVNGFVNGLAFASDGRFLLAATGQEHRLGRWEKIQGRNALALIPIPIPADTNDRA